MTAKINPKMELNIVYMVAAGWTNISIAHELGISLSTVQRVKIRTDTKSGDTWTKAIAEAKVKLQESISAEYARGKAASLIRDDFAMGEALRRKGAMMLEAIPERAETAKDAVIYARALTSLSTALKLSSDTLRQTLKLASPDLDDLDDLPILEVREMLDEEVTALREAQNLEAN